MSRVELFEKIRRDREFADLSLHALAGKYGVHRRTVRGRAIIYAKSNAYCLSPFAWLAGRERLPHIMRRGGDKPTELRR
jgi:hypothetical protein